MSRNYAERLNGYQETIQKGLDGVRFMRYFPDFAKHFGITDMYSGGFYPFPDEENNGSMMI